MDISNQMQEISSHECSLKGSSFFIGTEDAIAPIDDIDSIHILLILSHSLKGVIRIIWSKCI